MRDLNGVREWREKFRKKRQEEKEGARSRQKDEIKTAKNVREIERYPERDEEIEE